MGHCLGHARADSHRTPLPSIENRGHARRSSRQPRNVRRGRRLARTAYGLISNADVDVLLAWVTSVEDSGPLQLLPPSSETSVNTACSASLPSSTEKLVVLVRLGAPMSPLCSPASEPVVRSRGPSQPSSAE